MAPPEDTTREITELGHVLGWMGYGVLVLALPLAFLAMTVIVNEYRAFGIADDWFDCNSTSAEVFLGVPALAIYGAGAVINAFQFRRRLNFIVALVCALICVPVGINLAYAISEQNRPGFDEFCFGP